MRIASLSDFLLLHIDRTPGLPRGMPINRQIYQAIRKAILSQTLPVGLQLPSSRDLARDIAVSRNTVTYAYEQLLAEGYLETRAGAGTFVTDTTPDQLSQTLAPTAPIARWDRSTTDSAPASATTGPAWCR